MTQKSASPLLPAPYDPADVYAWKALQAGNASPGQQQRAVKHLVEVVARTYDTTFYAGPDGARLSDFAAGRRFVGQQIVKFLNYPQAKLSELAKHKVIDA